MIAKKNPRYNLEGKRIVIFSLGLLTTTAASLAAFTYQSPLNSEFEKQKIAAVPVDYILQEKEPEIIKPEVREDRPQTDQNMQKNDNDQDENQDDASDDISDDLLLGKNKDENPIKHVGAPKNGGGGIGLVTITPPVVEIPEIDAKYIGGYVAMQKFIVENFNYPQIDIEMGTQGTVYVNFVVEMDGSISNVVIERGLSTTLDREAKRIVKKFPKWIPGEVQAEAVRTRVRMPIKCTFK